MDMYMYATIVHWKSTNQTQGHKFPRLITLSSHGLGLAIGFVGCVFVDSSDEYLSVTCTTLTFLLPIIFLLLLMAASTSVWDLRWINATPDENNHRLDISQMCKLRVKLQYGKLTTFHSVPKSLSQKSYITSLIECIWEFQNITLWDTF